MGNLPGNYDPIQRKTSVLSKLTDGLAKLFTNQFSSQDNKNKRGNSSSNAKSDTEDDSTLMTSIKSELQKIEATCEKIKKFKGPHFTKEFRILRETCIQHQLSLDGFNTQVIELGNQDERAKRKDALILADEIFKQLNSKTHPDGKVCPDCELQNI